VCCQEAPAVCTDVTTASQAEITDFVWGCLFSHYPAAPVVAGACGAEGRCVPSS